MREIKAFVPISRAADVLESMRRAEADGAGILNLAVFPVQAMPQGRASNAHYSVELAEEVTSTAKVEVLCEAGEVSRISELIKREIGSAVGQRCWIIVTRTFMVQAVGGELDG